jgi:hypothetical protein
MAKGGGGKGGGGKGGGGKGGAASSGGGSSSSAASSGASAAASTPAQTKQETKVAAQEVKTAQRTTNQVAQEVKKTGAIANVDAYKQALAVLNASKPKAATKAEAKVQKMQTKAAAKNVATTGSLGTSTKPDEIAGLKSYFEDLLSKRDEELGTKFGDIGLKLEGQGDAFKEAMGEFGTSIKDQFSGYQDLLLQLKGSAAPAPYSAPASDQSDDFKAFDPNLFTDLLEQVQGGSSMEQRKQLQEFKQQDESRDYAQALKAYGF